MKKLKSLYIFIVILAVTLCASLAVLGSLLSNNIGKDRNTVSIVLPSISFEEEDDNLDEWDYAGEINIFGSNYGTNRDKVIAPGMSNTAKIVVDNRNVGVLDYEIVFHFSSSVDDFWIPLEFKITRYDEQNLTDGYVIVSSLDGLTDTHTLAGNRHSYYLVEWYWPEGANDTELGNYVLDNDIKINASIQVKTWKSEDQASLNGIITKYDMNPIWAVVNVIISLGIILIAYATCSTLHKLSMSKYFTYGGFTAKGPYRYNVPKRKFNRPRGELLFAGANEPRNSALRKNKKRKRKIGVRNE
jgi:hypothetical protein